MFQCVTCHKLEGPHYRAVPPLPLPEYHVKEAPQFACSGVDFAGPFYIKEPEGFGNSKVWIVLYTCCITCAVHFELVPDMIAQTFLRSFKRFISRRGVPVQMVSDNAKTYICSCSTDHCQCTDMPRGTATLCKHEGQVDFQPGKSTMVGWLLQENGTVYEAVP